MDFKTTVEQLLAAALDAHPGLFLIDLKVGSDRAIKVVLDGDQGVSLKDCVAVSRMIEHNLDREAEDFSLEVTSIGVGAPLTLARQYVKNVGRKLEVTTQAGEILSGQLIHANESDFELSWKTREAKAVGKGKTTVTKNKTLPYQDVKTAKVIVQF